MSADGPDRRGDAPNGRGGGSDGDGGPVLGRALRALGDRPPGFPDDLWGPGSPLRVIGHRGAAAVAPENTIPSFEHAVRVGADAVELDLHASADGHLIVIHDSTLDRTTDGTGPVEGRTLDELRGFDAGHHFTPDRAMTFPYRGKGVRIPTLDEVFRVIGDLPMVAEVKSAAAGRSLVGWLRDGVNREWRERLLIGGFERRDVESVSRLARWRCAYEGELRRWVLLGKLGLGRRFVPRGAVAAMLPERKGIIPVVTPRFVRQAHADGIGIFVWTVNRADDIRRLLAWGVDGLVSDAPGRVRRILDEMEAGDDTA